MTATPRSRASVRWGDRSGAPSSARQGDGRAGDAGWRPPATSPFDALLSKVLIPPVPGGCWIWLGAETWNRYGTVHFEGKQQLAHRIFFEHFRGKIPDGLILDHLCCNTICVNPFHLDPVTRRVNTLRGFKNPAAGNSRKQHCKRGHAFTEENTIRRRNGWRACRQCSQDYSRASWGRSIRDNPERRAKERERGRRYYRANQEKLLVRKREQWHSRKATT